MRLLDFARDELKRAGLFDKGSDYDGMLGDAVMKMLEQFSDEGHSGASAAMAVSIFSKLARYEPLSPLTGEDDEWDEPYTDDGTCQNKRCPHVFRRGDGSAYDSTGRVFREPNGVCFTGSGSRVDIEFPYTPNVEYVDVPESAT